MKRNTAFAAIAAVLLLLAAGCALPTGGTGSVALSIGESGSRTIAPADPSSVIARYDLLLDNYSESVELSVTDDEAVIADLQPGNWSIQVTARSTGGTVVGMGSAGFQVVSGKTSRVAVGIVYAAPEEGDPALGSVHLTIQVPASLNPWNVEIMLGSAAPITLDFSPDPGPGYPSYEWAILDTPIGVGSQSLAMTAYNDSEIVIDTLLESVIVLPETATTATIRYDATAGAFKIGRPPAAPENFAVAEVDLHGDPQRIYPVLTWQPVAGVYSLARETQPAPAVGYKIVKGYLDESDNIVWNEAGAFYPEPYDTSYVDVGWVPGASTYYGLRAFNEFGQSDQVVVAQSAVPEAPTQVFVTPGGTVSWKLAALAEGYKIYASYNDVRLYPLAQSDSFATYADGTRARFALTGPDLPPNVLTDPLYAFYVTSLNGTQEGPYSDYATIAAVTAPFGLSISAVGSTSIAVTASWSAIDQAEQYRVYMKNQYDQVSVVATIDASPTATSYYIPYLEAIIPENNDWYWFAVSALVGEEESALSAWKSDSGSDSGPGVHLNSGS